MAVLETGDKLIADARELGKRPRLSDETKAPRDAEHCDYPDCEQHWKFVVDIQTAALRQIEARGDHCSEIAEDALRRTALKAADPRFCSDGELHGVASSLPPWRTPLAKRFDFWLALAASLYVLNILGWVTYAVWRTWHV